MYKFFTQKKWFKWSILGSIFILISTWYQVQLDVKINEWFGDFYDTLQRALTTPNSVSEAEFIGYLFTFAKIAALWILIAVFTGVFTNATRDEAVAVAVNLARGEMERVIQKIVKINLYITNPSPI